MVVATRVLHQPVGFIVFAIFLTLIFVCINGISTGISDSNPISSAFVIAVLLMSALGLKDPTVGLMAASILLVACSTGVDMQQDRSTGWRLGTNRVIQFRYQVIGIVVGAILSVILANTFMKAYPVLRVDTFAHPEAKVDQWQSAMTFKFVGAIRDLGHLPGYKIKALVIGLCIGLFTEIARKLVRGSARYKAFTEASKGGFATGWVVDSILLPSPYASSFGGFVEVMVTLWFAAGGTLSSLINSFSDKPASGEKRHGADVGPEEHGDALPEDMSTTSLVGGGLIAGESIFALAVGVIGLLKLVA